MEWNGPKRKAWHGRHIICYIERKLFLQYIHIRLSAVLVDDVDGICVRPMLMHFNEREKVRQATHQHTRHIIKLY